MELKLTLKSLIQSYGESNPWTATRYTNTKPTETAVKGMIECALGLAREGTYSEDDKERLKIWENVKILINEPEHVPELLIDDQTVKPLTDDMFFVCAEGTKMSTGMPRITKEYIINEKYTVLLEGSDEYISKIKYRLIHPVYPFCYGRACCIPSAPIIQDDI